MMVTRDERLIDLASRWFDLPTCLAIRRRMIGTGLIGGKSVGHAPRPRDPREGGPRVGRAARDARLLLHRLRRLLHLPRPQRLLARAPRAAQRRLLPGRGGGGPGADPGGHLPGVPRGPVRGDARVFRPVADHRPVEQPPGGQLRQRLHGEVRQRLLPEPGVAAGAARGVPFGGPRRVRQHDERGGAPLPGAPGAHRPGRADGDPRAARVGSGPRGPVLPAGGGGGPVLQPVRVERADRPRGGGPAAGVRPGDARGGPVGRRLHPPGGAQRAASAPGRGGRPGTGGRSPSGGWTSSTSRRTGSPRRRSTTCCGRPRTCRSTCTPPGGARWPGAGTTRPAVREGWVLTFERLLADTAFVRGDAADARDPAGRLRVSRGHGIHGELPARRPVEDQPRAVPAAPGEGGGEDRRPAEADRRGAPSCSRPGGPSSGGAP